MIFFGVISWFFTRNTPKMFAPPSTRRNFLKYGLLAWNPGSAPETWQVILNWSHKTRNSSTCRVLVLFYITVWSCIYPYICQSCTRPIYRFQWELEANLLNGPFLILFCRSLFDIFTFFFCLLYCLPFRNLRVLITRLVSSNFSYIEINNCKHCKTTSPIFNVRYIHTIRLFPHSRHISTFVTGRMPLVDQELLTFSEQLSSPRVFMGFVLLDL
jgi:hypothetical protein